ncbi:hypothetical protein [Serratia liquefaciens]|uniref:hypothetical protein n=1 Tax=Serratia liquefaciens TaxID=614 RepID=UPI0021C6ABD9|nr:hypothetical protein [Serratia liquefaciens]
MKKVLLITALFISGCSTVGSLRERSPTLDGSSKKSEQEFVYCVINEWNKHSYLQPMVTQPLPDGHSLQFNDPWRGPVFILDVVKNGDGSNYRLYRSKNIDFYERAITQCK